MKVTSTFDAMGIREDLLRGLYSYGFEKPSAIQQRAIMPICSGRDVIAQAQSGTGKTSMIFARLCQMLDTSTREVQALVLSPTRELATQTEKTALALGDYMSVQRARVHRREIRQRGHQAPQRWRAHRQRHPRTRLT